MYKSFACFFILAITNSVFAQSTFRKNTVYGQLAGGGIFLSVNYERQLSDKPGLGVHVGLGEGSTGDFRVTIPAGVNYLVNLSHNKSFIDAGIGATLTQAAIMNDKLRYVDENRYMASLVPRIGFRHQSNWGLMWRIGFSPIINRYRFIPFPEISLGMAFK